MTESRCELADWIRKSLTINHIKSERCIKKRTSPALSRSVSENSQFAGLAEHVSDVLDAHLGVDMLAVRVHRVDGQESACGNLRRRQAFGAQADHFDFARGQADVGNPPQYLVVKYNAGWEVESWSTGLKEKDSSGKYKWVLQ